LIVHDDTVGQRRGNITGAREIFKLGISLNCSDLTRLYHAWGLLELKANPGKADVAADIFRRGIELGLCGDREVEPGVDFLFHSLGMLQLDTRQFAEAKRIFEAGVGLFPRHSHMLLGLALALMRMGQHGHARDCFRAAVDADCHHLHAWQSWAIAEKQLGNVELARVLFRQGLKHGPMHGALWQGYAVMEMQQGSPEIARTLFAEAVKRAPLHAQSYQAWACLEAREGHLLYAKALAWQGIKRAPPHAALWTVAGLVEDRMGETERAKRVLEEGIRRFPMYVIYSSCSCCVLGVDELLRFFAGTAHCTKYWARLRCAKVTSPPPERTSRGVLTRTRITPLSTTPRPF
jgi:tetratricopeptide (TPR) repeat protein